MPSPGAPVPDGPAPALPDYGPPPGEDPAAGVARAFRGLIGDGWRLPLPGGGATLDRWQALRALGARDLGLARLAEGHADAVAIMTELGGRAPEGARLGVWAAEPPADRLFARRSGGVWVLDGRKAWCSGVGSLTHALVTAWDGDGQQRLFLVELAADGVALDSSGWVGAGMRSSATGRASFAGVPAEPVGGQEAYQDRPGFWHGGIGVAAVWAGGAIAVSDRLHDAAAARAPDPFSAAAVGRADVALTAADSVLRTAAAEVDAVPSDLPAARLRALRVRAVVAAAVDEVLAVVGRALGPGPLAFDGEHAGRVADLGVYVRQHHGERDLAALGALVRAPVDT